MATRFTHILVPMDFSPASDAALATAKELAQRFHTRLSLLHAVTDPTATGVWTPDVYVAANPETQERFLREATQRLRASVTEAERERFRAAFEARIGGAADVIQEFAREQGVTLIVMGTHGRTGLMHMLLGSVAERTVRMAPCPVLTTHTEDRIVPDLAMAQTPPELAAIEVPLLASE